MLLVLKHFALAFSALLPVINPLGSAFIFLGIVGNAPVDFLRRLSRTVAFNMVLFLLIFEAGGAALLNFFGISLPVVQLAGGFVLAAMGWELLNAKDKDKDPSPNTNELSAVVRSPDALREKAFYPLAFPITAGPGCIVVTLTLSAHASRHDVLGNVLAHLGIALAIVVLGVTVWLSYAYAPKFTHKIAPATVSGILRVVAFVLLCIGVQIAANGLTPIIRAVSK